MTPTVLWAQRADLVYLTICLGDIKNKVLNLTDSSLSFKGKAGTPKQLDYAVDVQFFEKIDPDNSRQTCTDRQIVMIIKKASASFWPRLLKSTEKAIWLKTDFERWVDEDEAEADPEGGNMDFSNMMSQMSGFDSGANYDDIDGDIDSDDDDLPDLEMSSGDAPLVTGDAPLVTGDEKVPNETEKPVSPKKLVEENTPAVAISENGNK